MNKIAISIGATIMATMSAGATTVDLASVQLVSQRSAEQHTVKPTMQRANVRGSSLFFEDFQDQVDPTMPVLPADWLLFNVDMLTPNPSVGFVTEAWTIRDDFATPSPDPKDPDIALFSTSWYSPVGTANDWVITPMISLPAASELSWVANAPDVSYADGYEVYVSNTTQDIAGCQAGGTVFTIPAENSVDTARAVSLSNAGYMNEDVYICFRNNSNDKYLLVLDDIRVDGLVDNNLTLDTVAALPEYSQYPILLPAINIPLSVDFTNNGGLPQSNVTASVDIELNGMLVGGAGSVFPGPLAPGDSASVNLFSFPAASLGTYDALYDVLLDGVPDENPFDNIFDVLNVIEITEDVMSRDTGPSLGGVGANNVEEANLGNMFEFTADVSVGSVLFTHSNSQCDVGNTEACGLDGESIFVDVFPIDGVSGLPGALLSSSESYLVPAVPGGYADLQVEVAFTDGLNLTAGQYLFAVRQPARTVSTFANTNVELGRTEERFTPGTVWGRVTSEGVTGDWTLLEDFALPNTLQVKVKLINDDIIFKDGFE